MTNSEVVPTLRVLLRSTEKGGVWFSPSEMLAAIEDLLAANVRIDAAAWVEIGRFQDNWLEFMGEDGQRRGDRLLKCARTCNKASADALVEAFEIQENG